jgi:ABC-type glycerol-3-phosphate transport system substrate-binding protein
MRMKITKKETIMRRGKCLFAMAVLFFISLPGLFAGGQKAPDSGQTPVTITWGVYETDNLTADLWAGIISAFEADNPNIKIRKVLAAGDDRASFWRTMQASGNFPDVVLEAEVYASIPGIFAEVPEDIIAQFDPAVLAVYGGKYITIPGMKQLRMQCYYNKADFAALNLREPQTWEEFLNVCRTLKAAGKVPLICGGTGDVWATGAPYWISAANQVLIDAYPNFNADLKSGRVKWNNPALADALTQWQNLVKSGYYHPGCMSFSYSQAAAEFQNGAASMMIDGSWAAAGFDAAGNTGFGVFAMPNPKNLKTYCAAVSYWGVSAQSKNKEAAFAFVKYVLGGNETIYRNYLKADGLSSTTKKPVNYDQGPVMNKFVQNWNSYTLTPEINKVAGDLAIPIGVESFIDKSLQNIFNGAGIAGELESWDAEYQHLLAAQ